MRIALCDDDTASLDLLEGFLNAFSKERNIELAIDRYLRGEDLLVAERAQQTYDIIFMDIYLSPEGTGFTGTETIRQLNSSVKQQVVFITTSTEHAVEAFGLNATHYLIKPLTQACVTEAMERCIERSGQGLSSLLTVKTKQGMVSIPMEHIIFIEIFNKISLIHTKKESGPDLCFP